MAFGSTNMTGQHKNTHKEGGVDAIAPADIGAAPKTHNHKKSEITDFPTSLAPTAHKDTHKKEGTDPITPADIGAAPESHTHDDRYVRLCTILLPKGRRVGDINGDGKVDSVDLNLLGSDKYFGQELSEYVPENEDDRIAILAADINGSGDINAVDLNGLLGATNREHAFSRDVLGVWKTREDLPETDDGLTYIFYLDFPVSGVTEQDTAFLLASGSNFFQGDVACLNGKIQVRCMAPPPDDLPALVVFYRSLVTHL